MKLRPGEGIVIVRTERGEFFFAKGWVDPGSLTLTVDLPEVSIFEEPPRVNVPRNDVEVTLKQSQWMFGYPDMEPEQPPQKQLPEPPRALTPGLDWISEHGGS